MVFLRRLSPGPTVPDLMQAELRAWRQDRMHVLSRRSRARTCLMAAGLVLGSARILLRLGLIEPECAGQAFRIAARLTRSGLSSSAGMVRKQAA